MISRPEAERIESYLTDEQLRTETDMVKNKTVVGSGNQKVASEFNGLSLEQVNQVLERRERAEKLKNAEALRHIQMQSSR